VRYYLAKYMAAKRLLQVVRSHWGIENRLHWVLDVVFDEDGSRIRKHDGSENPAVVRRLAVNIIRNRPAATVLPQPSCRNHPARLSMPQKNQARWLGRRLPPRPPQPNAIALAEPGGSLGYQSAQKSSPSCKASKNRIHALE
jgi:hypothetical protein